VIAFKACQELALALMRPTCRWQRLSQSIAAWWSPDRVAAFAAREPAAAVLAPDASAAVREAVHRQLVAPEALLDWARRIRQRRFELLGAAVPQDGPWPWHEDWRYGHRFAPAYFRNYDFYRRRADEPWDVKIPWELSRLGFLLPLAQAAVIEPEGGWRDTVLDVAADWERSNPLAYSVAWHPMEASIRAVNLVFLLEMLQSSAAPAAIAPLVRLVASHGEFVWRTLEYTDVRGNHYAANLAALAVCGLALRGWYPRAERWLAHAAAAITGEIPLHLAPDGVHLEKSIAYHRLVAELFLVAAIALARAGMPIRPAASARLHQACRYTAACIRPDGLVPNVGDNDDARVLAFDPVPPRDHRPLVGTAAAFWCDVLLKATAGRMPMALPWLLGPTGLGAWQSMAELALPDFDEYFFTGGVVVARHRGAMLWMEVGEVGLAGRGGHGHNDLLSFELVLGGRPVVVDPGCPVYAGDPDRRNLARSTRYHNGLCVDGAEIAPLGGIWEIAGDALPRDVAVQSDGQGLVIRAAHTGYRRLVDPVLHARQVRFDPRRQRFVCQDTLRCQGKHAVERYLHLDPAVQPTAGGDRLVLASGGRRWVLTWDDGAQVRCECGWVSPGYGVTSDSTIVVLANRIEGTTELEFAIQPEGALGE